MYSLSRMIICVFLIFCTAFCFNHIELEMVAAFRIWKVVALCHKDELVVSNFVVRYPCKQDQTNSKKIWQNLTISYKIGKHTCMFNQIVTLLRGGKTTPNIKIVYSFVVHSNAVASFQLHIKQTQYLSSRRRLLFFGRETANSC